MQRDAVARPLLLVAGFASAAMGAFHFALPTIFHWERFITTIPAPIRWGVVSINVFLSTLMLLGGVATILVARRLASDPGTGSDPGGAAIGGVANAAGDGLVPKGMAIFWFVNVGYQIVRPFPVNGVRWVLLGFALVNFAAYAGGLWARARAPARRAGAQANGRRGLS
jgi:hypothetical protein